MTTKVSHSMTESLRLEHELNVPFVGLMGVMPATSIRWIDE
jgi:hypothetical protein